MSSNDTYIRQLQLSTQYMTFAYGFPVLIIGLIGNILNIIIFLYLGNYKRNSSSFYMLAKSFFDLNALIIGLIGHILIQGFRTNAITSENWCKFRIPLLYINSLCSYTCLCFQSIDSYICSSRNANIRKYSTVKKGHYFIFIFIIIWFCNECPYYFFTPLSIIPNWRCQTTNTIYALYRSYFTILTLSIFIPIITICLFGYLTYKNIHTLNTYERSRISTFSKQTIRMTLYEIGIVLIFQFPYGISQIYFISTTNIVKDIYRQTQEQFANVFFFIYAYNANAAPFYCYYLASKQFRKQVIDILKRLKSNWRRNQVLPLTQTSHTPIQRQATNI